MIRNADHWRIETPRSSHYRTASCAEVNCVSYYLGFQVLLTLDGTQDYLMVEIRQSKMEYTEEQIGGGLIRFVFSPGQECFEGQAGEHKTNLERDPIFLKNRTVQEFNQWQDGIGESLYRLGRQ
jgi:hypothetical protein